MKLRLAPRLPLQVWLIASYGLVFSLPFAALVGTGALAGDLVNQTKEDLEHQGALISMIAAQEMDRPAVMSPMLAEAKEQTLSGIRIVDGSGIVVASSGSSVGEDLSDDKEVRTALAGSPGLAIKPREAVPISRADRSSYGETKSRHADIRVFVTVPITRKGEVLGAVVLSRTPREEIQAFLNMAPRLWKGVFLAVLLTAGLSLFAGWRASRSLRALAELSERMAAGQPLNEREFAELAESRIAETAALADAMGAMTARLRARLAYIGEFAGNVSHEFKTPVSALRGTVELLRDDDAMPPEQRVRFLDNALADLDRLSNLVGGLLRLARAEEGGGRERLELDAVVERVLARFPGVPVTGQSGPVEGNAEQLDAVVSNLLQNAQRYGGPEVRVERWRRGGHAGIDVIDNGPGIDPSHQGQLFERFFTTDRARGGTGLGLALVKAIAEAHGGGVRVESKPGETRFSVWVAGKG